MSLPPYQPRRLPEGEYIFTISKEPEKKWKGIEPNKFIAITFYFKAEAPNGSIRNHVESILPWDDKYRDLLLAVGGEEDDAGEIHLSEMFDVIGKVFKARIVHEQDKDDPSKSWARISGIEVPKKKSAQEEDVPPPINEEESKDEVPF